MSLRVVVRCLTGCTLLCICSDASGKTGDKWSSGGQFHCPAAGSPDRTAGNPIPGNPWQYGFRMARGYNDGKWSHMNASPFQPFRVFDELGPAAASEADSGPDLNRWWVPFPAPPGEATVGQVRFAEGAVDSGGEKYLARQVHLLTDDDAPTNGIVSMRWVAPGDGVYRISVELENRLEADKSARRDPFYNVLVNDQVLHENVLEGFGKKARHEYVGLALKAGDTVEVCASTGSMAFPFAMLATNVTIEELSPSEAVAAPAQLAALQKQRERGPEPVLKIADNHPYAASMKKSAEWVKQNLGPEAIGLPISFTYDGKPMFRAPYGGGPMPADHLSGWKQTRTWEHLDDGRLRKTITCRELKTDLELRLEATEYADFPVVEWVIHFKNAGDKDTPILEHIQPLNAMLEANKWLLHHSAGSWPGAASYAPYASAIEPGRMLKFSAYGGRPSNTDMPYFNFEQDDEGVILAVGWPGQWEASFHRDQNRALHLEAGQQLTHLRLRPGEEVRSPLIVLQFRKGGDWIDGQNVWRRWMIGHNQPRPGGQPIAPMFSGSAGYFMDWMYKGTEENQIEMIDLYLKRGIDIDHWWMDTGWYTPTWLPVPDRFPRGIRPVSEHAHSKGIKTILWFEPERVTPENPIGKEHAPWVLHATETNQGLFNLGDPEALKWMTNHIHKILEENEVDVFRSDFNMDPLEHWRQNDAPDRQGVTENHFVSGYLAFWDGLLERMPHLLIDSCASGGRRNDLETMRRSVPLWKCDYAIEPTAMQCQVYGLSMWLPYYGNCGGQIDKYVFRSNMYPAINKGAWEDRTPTRDIRDDKLDYELMRKLIAEWRRVAPNYSGDFYPLSPYSLENSTWIAWQYNTPESGQGFVQAFRRKDAAEDVQHFRLRGLDPGANYEVEDLDTAEKSTVSGRELMDQGIDVHVAEQPAAKIFDYRKVQ